MRDSEYNANEQLAAMRSTNPMFDTLDARMDELLRTMPRVSPRTRQDVPPLTASAEALAKVMAYSYSPAPIQDEAMRTVNHNAFMFALRREQEQQRRIDAGEECPACHTRYADDIERHDAITPLFVCLACNASWFDLGGAK